MIGKIFWPKEVKVLIAQYRSEHKLNNKAISILEQYSALNFWAVLAFALVLFLCSEELYSLMIALSAPLCSWWSVRIVFHYWMAAYTLGEKRDVRIIKSGVNIYGVGRTKYSEIDGSGEGLMRMPAQQALNKLLSSEQSHSKFLSWGEVIGMNGSIIKVYQDPQKKHLAMPDIDKLKRMYSLRNDVE